MLNVGLANKRLAAARRTLRRCAANPHPVNCFSNRERWVRLIRKVDAMDSSRRWGFWYCCDSRSWNNAIRPPIARASGISCPELRRVTRQLRPDGVSHRIRTCQRSHGSEGPGNVWMGNCLSPAHTESSPRLSYVGVPRGSNPVRGPRSISVSVTSAALGVTGRATSITRSPRSQSFSAALSSEPSGRRLERQGALVGLPAPVPHARRHRSRTKRTIR